MRRGAHHAGRRAAAGVTLLLGAIALGGCSSVMSIFEAEKPKPTPLEPFTATIAGRQVWSLRLDGVQFPLVVAVNGGVFTVAGNDGTVASIDAESGRELWRTPVGAKLSAGVGSDGRFASVVTRDGELIVLDAGKLLWRKPLGVRVTTPPLVAGERVFVLGVDRVVQAFDALDGRKLWELKRPGDPLTLAHAGALAAFKDTLIAGQGPRMAGLDPLRGTVRWEVTIGSPRGANEVERLADLIGPVARVGDTVCARSFQAAVGCVDAERGVLGWTKNVGGIRAIAADEQFVFGADGSDRLTAWKTVGGDVAWTSEKFLRRGLSAPVSVGKTVIFGDVEGQVHFVSRDSGVTQLRLPTDGSAVVVPPAVSGSTVLIVTSNGGLFAFRPQ